MGDVHVIKRLVLENVVVMQDILDPVVTVALVQLIVLEE